MGAPLVIMGLPPIVSTGAGAGEVATAPCSTGFPLNFFGSVAAGAGAGAAARGAPMSLPLISRTCSRKSAFSLESLALLFSNASRRFITASRAGSAHAPDDMAKLRAASATPARYCLFMAPPCSSPSSIPLGSGPYADLCGWWPDQCQIQCDPLLNVIDVRCPGFADFP